MGVIKWSDTLYARYVALLANGPDTRLQTIYAGYTKDEFITERTSSIYDEE